MVLENQSQNQKPDVKTGTASNSGNGDGSKKKGRNHQTAASDCSNSTQGSDRRLGNENQGRQNSSAQGSGPPHQSRNAN